MSPLRHCRFTTVYVGPGAAATLCPLTVSEGAEHQPGMRRCSGNVTGLEVVRRSVTVSSNG